MDSSRIKKTIEDLLRSMNVPFGSVEVVEGGGEKTPRFVIKTADSAILIGNHGEHLQAINYIVRRIAAKGETKEETMKFMVDVNDYQEKAMESLRTKAKIMSERARSFKVDVELEPMSPYERMLVHSYLEGAPDVKTESRGEGRGRRIVIRYIPSGESF